MRHKLLSAIILGAVLLAGLLLALNPTSSEAAPDRLPPRPEDSKDGGRGGDEDPPGAYIELHSPDASAGLWAVVQWKDRDGNWHDIEQWWGTLDTNNSEKWWVAAKDFNTGPFRWQITRGKGGAVLATSDNFNMPGEAGRILLITLSVGS